MLLLEVHQDTHIQRSTLTRTKGIEGQGGEVLDLLFDNESPVVGSILMR